MPADEILQRDKGTGRTRQSETRTAEHVRVINQSQGRGGDRTETKTMAHGSQNINTGHALKTKQTRAAFW